GDPGDYSFTFDREVAQDLTPHELRQASDHFANAFSEAEIPMSVAQSLFRSMQDAQKAYQNVTDPNALKLKFAEEGSKINRIKWNSAREDHEYAFAKFSERFRKWANANFVFHSADAFLALANAGRLMQERVARRSKK